MRTLFVAAAAAVAIAALSTQSAAQVPLDRAGIAPVPATVFAGLRTIYVASGVLSTGDGDNAGSATVVHCSNVGGLASMRVLFHGNDGVLKGTHSFSLPVRGTYTVATKGVNVFGDVPVGTGPIVKGRVAVLATHSAVFCSAMVVNAAASVPEGIALHMVRFSPHPGTAE